MVWKKVDDVDDYGVGLLRWWNQDDKSSRVIDVWQYDKKDANSWRATVNNSWLAQDVSKAKAMSEAKAYMERVS